MAEVMTVLGPVAPDMLGRTLPHEHLLIDLARVTRNFDHFLHDVSLATIEARRFRDAGGTTIVDLTNRNLGRDARGLCAIAEQTGLNIVMGSGWYREPYYDRDVYQKSTNQLADDIVRDIVEGVDGTGIRAGIIGEIGSDDRLPISPAEERSFRAAARAHRRTGLTISTHAARWPVGLDQLALLTSEGVDPRRVIVGHADSVPIPEYHLALAEQGCYVSFDGIGTGSRYDLDEARRYLLNLVQAGFGAQILLSHDVCLRDHLRAHGGCGYGFLITEFLPMLAAAGLDAAQVRGLVTANPRAALPGQP